MNGITLQRTVLITNPHGLHMRPSAAFVEMAGRYQCNVAVTHGGRTVNGKSLWDLMLLAAEPGSELTLEVDGPDAPAALDALVGVLATIPEDPPVPALELPRHPEKD
jgi:phosphotransferase system HPr (HPr) family protein